MKYTKHTEKQSTKQNKEDLIDLAKKACDRFDGFAQVGGSNYAFVDLTKYEVTLK